MKRAGKWIAAALLGAIAPAALVAYALGTTEVFAIAAAITLGHVVLLGLPVALLFGRLNWRSPVLALAGGLLVGALPAGLYFWPLDPGRGTSAWSGDTATLIDGVPTWAGWLEYVVMLVGFGCLGELGAFAFWLTLKVTGELRAQ